MHGLKMVRCGRLEEIMAGDYPGWGEGWFVTRNELSWDVI